MKYVIFDLDGCLADDRRRQPLIDLAASDPFEAYHSDCHLDPLINSYLFDRTAHLGLKPFIFTARPEKLREKTLWWLREVAGLKIASEQLFMRPEGCLKKSPELKKDYLDSLLKSGLKRGDIVLAFDDREDVLAVYESAGILTEKISYPPGESLAAPELLAAEKLEAMAQTFRDRNKVYGSNYKMVGKVMKVLFPNGVPKDLVFEEHFHLFELLLVKISRYAISNLTHTDSIHDAAVYAAMCEAINDQKKEN
jgi:hypothetical protein